MNKKQIFVIAIVTVLLVLLGVGGSFFFFHRESKDALKFKEEYESLNDTIRESDGALYNTVHIDKNNPITYVTVEEAIPLLKNKKAILYIGANWCPWCRNMLEPMFAVAKELNIDTIYYLNLDDDKSNFEIQDGELKKVSNGSEGYYQLLEELKDYLEDYELKGEDGTSYPTGEKRIYMPFFVTVRNGSIVEAKGISRTLESGQDKYSPMTQGQYDALYSEFMKTFQKIYSTEGTCPPEEECN